MASRTFKQKTVVAGGTPQPLVFTTLGAATSVSDTAQSILVADSSDFRSGDWIVIGTKAVGDEERLNIINIPDGTHIKVNFLEKTHLSGAYVRWANSVNSVYVQRDLTGAGVLFIGTQNMVKATLANVIATLFNSATGQPIDFSDARGDSTNSGVGGDLWCDGTTADKYSVSFGVA